MLIRFIKPLLITSITILFVLFLACIYLFHASFFAMADDGYIDGNVIVIDGITYKAGESNFSGIKTVTAVSSSGHNSYYDDPIPYHQPDPLYSDYPYTDSTVIPETGSTDGKTLLPSKICYTPSYSYCKNIQGLSIMTAVGDPETGYNERYPSFWQKVNHEGITYYVPVDEIQYLENTDTEDKTEEDEMKGDGIIEGDIKGNLTGNLKSTNSPVKTCAWAYRDNDGNLKPQETLSQVLDWCSDYKVDENMIAEQISRDINYNLNNISPYPKDLMKTCIWGIEKKNQNSDEYEDVMKWCNANGLNRSEVEKELERMRNTLSIGPVMQNGSFYFDEGDKKYSKDKIYKELDDYFNVIMNLEKTKKWGINEFSKNYQDVIDWYEEIKSYDINVTYYAEGDVGNVFYYVWKLIKDRKSSLTFSIAKEREHVNQYRSNGNPTFILIHGWKSNPDAWADDMGRLILDEYGNDVQILAIDWSEVVSKWHDGGFAPEIASTWIESISETSAERLKNWRMDPGNTTIIGHSLGAFLGYELAKDIEGINDGQKLEQVNFIALDPAASLFNLGYEINTEGDWLNTFNNNGSTFVADGSLSGSQDLMEKSDEKYLYRYDDTNDTSDISDTEREAGINFTVAGAETLTENALSKMKDTEVKFEALDIGVTMEIYAYIKGKKTFIGSATGIAIGQVSKIPCLLAIEGSPALVAACGAAVETAVNATIGQIKLAAKDKHAWTYDTYMEIMRHPFGTISLLPKNTANRLHTDTDLDIEKGFYKKADAVIYTENHNPTSIKYLKVQKKNTDYYTLYGNSQENYMDCDIDRGDLYNDEGRDCIMYGGNGNDRFIQTATSYDYTPMDFDEYNDKMYLYGGLALNKTSISVEYDDEKSMNYISVNKGSLINSRKRVYVPGYSYGDIDGWVKKAKDAFVKHEINNNTPIRITTN